MRKRDSCFNDDFGQDVVFGVVEAATLRCNISLILLEARLYLARR
jgi:hypothetical protein